MACYHYIFLFQQSAKKSCHARTTLPGLAVFWLDYRFLTLLPVYPSVEQNITIFFAILMKKLVVFVLLNMCLQVDFMLQFLQSMVQPCVDTRFCHLVTPTPYITTACDIHYYCSLNFSLRFTTAIASYNNLESFPVNCNSVANLPAPPGRQSMQMSTSSRSTPISPGSRRVHVAQTMQFAVQVIATSVLRTLSPQ